MNILTEKFLEKYPDFAPHQQPISTFTYLRTYSRFIPQKKRREVWKETVKRAVEFLIGLEIKHRKKLGLPIDMKALRKEAEELYDNIFNLRQFPSGRTLWVGGADNGLGERFALANFNCSFTLICSLVKDLPELFYLLLVGTGVGFKCTPKMAENLELVNMDFEIVHEPYNYVGAPGLLEYTKCSMVRNENAFRIVVGDSKEGWVGALRQFLEIITDTNRPIDRIYFNYDYVRPAGTRLKTFGGTASGHEPLMEMFDGFYKIITNQIDPYLPPLEVKLTVGGKRYGQLRPIHVLDMGNLIGYNVVVGGVRRTAEIFGIGDEPMDWESVFAKYAINGLWGEDHFKQHEEIGQLLDELGVEKPKWWDEVGKRKWNVKGKFFDTEEEAHAYIATLDEEERKDTFVFYPANEGRPIHHRRMSNNSIAFTKKPKRKILNLVFKIMKLTGEPGFVNLRELAMRRFRALGIENPTEEMIQEMMEEIFMNPCAEIDLRNKGVCNLTTVNVSQFVHEYQGKYFLDTVGLIEAQKRSARIGLRMTLIQLELSNWDEVQQKDRLLGTSLTGWKDAMSKLGFSLDDEKELLKELRKVAKEEADRFAKELRVNAPLLVTTVKPEGTLSLVGNAVSSGLHVAHSPYYIRRIRINAHDPLAKAVRELGWKVHAEIGTLGYNDEANLARPEVIDQARTIVVDFPVASGANKTKFDVTVEEQLETYFMFQKYYCDHNASNTITVQAEKGEWEKAEEIIYNRWDEFAAVSFLPLDGGTYTLAPYEAITKEEYEKLAASMKPFDMRILQKYDVPEIEDDLLVDADCASGACPIR